jgi:catechol 2,3-dioxygenase-like lactoylglutathione lyase family enzyme
VDHIAFLGLAVSDQDRALQFYEALGFEKVSDRDGGDGYRWLTVTPPGAQTGLTLAHDPSAAGQTTFVYATADIGALYDLWSEKGIAFKEPPTPQMWGIQAILEDPDGNTIVVVQPV